MCLCNFLCGTSSAVLSLLTDERYPMQSPLRAFRIHLLSWSSRKVAWRVKICLLPIRSVLEPFLLFGNSWQVRPSLLRRETLLFLIFVLKYGIDGRTWKLVRVGSFWFCCLVKLGVTGQEEKRRKLRKILYSTHKNTVLFLWKALAQAVHGPLFTKTRFYQSQ